MSLTRKKIMRRMHGMMFKLPAMITCEEFDDFILTYLEDDLPPRKKTVFEMHLKLCRECRDYLNAYRAAMTMTKQALEDDDEFRPEIIPEDLIAAVLAARHA